MLEFDNITRGIWELYFFDNIGFVWVLELDVIAGGIGKIDFFDDIGFV
jgi:hypothetical protein